MKPKISIITVCYNSEKYIEEAIISVISQSYINKEYVIIDGGSTDNTINIINKYRDKVDYFISEPDSGISEAFNKGIKASSGDLIGIINSDDRLADEALYNLASQYATNIGVYRGNLLIFNSDNGDIYEQRPAMKFPRLALDLRVCHPSTFITKKVYEKYGKYDVNLKYAMDFDLMRRLNESGEKFLYVNKPLAYFRLGGISQSSDRKKNDELIYITRKNNANYLQVLLFSFYIKFRTLLKNVISQINKEHLKFRIGGKKIIQS